MQIVKRYKTLALALLASVARADLYPPALKRLEDLEAACAEEAIKSKKELSQPKLGVGMFCLARFEDTWNRGRIEFENEDSFTIFFVDHGDFVFVPKADVLPISQTLLLRLPCQAVECRLVGLEPEQECSLEVLRRIYDFSNDGVDDLYARVVDKCATSKITGGPKYVINLLNCSGKSLSKQLASTKTVLLKESEKEHLEDVNLDLAGSLSEDNKNLDQNSEEEDNPAEDEDGGYNSEADVPSTMVAAGELLPISSLMSKDLFESEEGHRFLEEFALKIFGGNHPADKLDSIEKSAEECLGNQDKIERTNPSETGAEKTESHREASKSYHRFKNTTKRRKKKRKKKENEMMKKDLLLRTRENVLTPSILWSQDPSEIRVKVMLANVENYKLDCSINNVLFRCLVDDKLYAVDLKLFGAVSSHLTEVAPKAFHLVITLKKLAPPPWPRLLEDEVKPWWISWDPESLKDKENSTSEMIQSVKRDLNNGIVKEGIRAEIIRACSDSEDQGETIDSEESE